jgi:hypothetical protein
VEQAVLTFHVCFSVSKALPPLENRSSSHCIVSIGLMDELYGSEFNRATLTLHSGNIWLLRHPEKGSFKTIVTQTLTTVRGMKITPLLRYLHHYNLA